MVGQSAIYCDCGCRVQGVLGSLVGGSRQGGCQKNISVWFSISGGETKSIDQFYAFEAFATGMNSFGCMNSEKIPPEYTGGSTRRDTTHINTLPTPPVYYGCCILQLIQCFNPVEMTNAYPSIGANPLVVGGHQPTTQPRFQSGGSLNIIISYTCTVI